MPGWARRPRTPRGGPEIMMAELMEKQTPFMAAIQGEDGASVPAGPAWLADLRREGRERFLAAGLPRSTEEAWRFTSLKSLAKRAFLPAGRAPEGAVTAAAVGSLTRIPDGVHRAVFVNGFYAPELSSAGDGPDGIRVESLARAWSTSGDALGDDLGRLVDTGRHRFAALNAAHFMDGAWIRVPANRGGDTPVHLLFITLDADPPRAAYPRVLISLEAGARARVIEEHVPLGDGLYLANAVTEIRVGDNASLEHARLQGESDKALHLGVVSAAVGRDARLLSHSVSLGGRLSRIDIDVTLAGEGGSCVLNGLYLPRGRQHMDHHTHVDHAQPHTNSDELYKGVLDGKSTGVFNGRVLIRPGAQKTEAAQTNNNLLLSMDALVNTNPELEIFADDVKARHGATIGQIEDEHLFYLRSRGIDLNEARKLLIRGFVGDMIERITVEPLRRTLSELVGERF